MNRFKGIRLLFWLAVALYVFANLQKTAVPGPIFGQLQESLPLSPGGIAALGSGFMLCYALMQLPVGAVADRWGGIRVILFGGAVFTLGSVGFPLATGSVLPIAMRALTGIGAASVYLALTRECADQDPERFPVWLGILAALGFSGGIAAGAPLIAAADSWGWRSALGFVGLVTALLWTAFLLRFLQKKPAPVKRPSTAISWQTFAAILKIPHNRWLFGYAGPGFGLYYALQTVIAAKYLEDFCGFSPLATGWTISIMALFSCFANLVAALLSHRMGDRRIPFMRLNGAGAAAGFGLLTLITALNWRTPLPAVIFCALALTSNVGAVTMSLLRETNRPEWTGTAASLSNFIAYSSVALIGQCAGWLLGLFPATQETGRTVYGQWSYLAVFAVMFAVALVVRRNAFLLREPLHQSAASTQSSGNAGN